MRKRDDGGEPARQRSQEGKAASDSGNKGKWERREGVPLRGGNVRSSRKTEYRKVQSVTINGQVREARLPGLASPSVRLSLLEWFGVNGTHAKHLAEHLACPEYPTRVRCGGRGKGSGHCPCPHRCHAHHT